MVCTVFSFIVLTPSAHSDERRPQKFQSPFFLLQTVSIKCCLPAIIKTACGAASEEASCIPLPPRRRKLHIRWLLLPFRKPTAALGRLSVNIRKEREHSKPEVQTVPPSRQKKPAPFRFRRAAKTPYPQPSSSFPNCDRFTGSQFGFSGLRRAARYLDDGGQAAADRFCDAAPPKGDAQSAETFRVVGTDETDG